MRNQSKNEAPGWSKWLSAVFIFAAGYVTSGIVNRNIKDESAVLPITTHEAAFVDDPTYARGNPSSIVCPDPTIDLLVRQNGGWGTIPPSND